MKYRIVSDDCHFDTRTTIVDETQRIVAQVVDEPSTRLLATAPELLEALKALRKEIRAHHKMNVKRDYSLMVADVAAENAIRAAEGRS